jgi:hypothetical protein
MRGYDGLELECRQGSLFGCKRADSTLGSCGTAHQLEETQTFEPSGLKQSSAKVEHWNSCRKYLEIQMENLGKTKKTQR